MGSQFRNLREHAKKLLNFYPTTDHKLSKNNISKLLDELVTHQMELEIQNINLLESQEKAEVMLKKYNDLYNLAPIGYFTIDIYGLITEVNSAGAELLGIKKEQLIKRAFVRYLAPESQGVFSEYRELVFKRKYLQPCELKLLRRNKSSLYVQMNCKVIDEENKRKMLLMLTDIAYYKESKQVSSSNEITSYIANELNNPLGVISNYIHGCIRNLEKKSYDSQSILLAMKQASVQLNRASEIILRMQNFHYKGQLAEQLICINSLIRETITLIKDELQTSTLMVHYRENSNIPKVFADKLHIQQVILNLIRNSIEVMEDDNIADKKITIEVDQPNKEYIEITVMDNGPGLRKDLMHKVFEPNFSTKTYGIGLGLSISRSIIESHGGKLFINDNHYYGACFKFTLPTRNKNI